VDGCGRPRGTAFRSMGMSARPAVRKRRLSRASGVRISLAAFLSGADGTACRSLLGLAIPPSVVTASSARTLATNRYKNWLFSA
jgi:hypothetical protein